MGCKESKPGCGEAKRKKEIKNQYRSGQDSCELIALKSEATNTAHLHNEAKERTTAAEEEARLRRQPQAEEDCLKDVHHAETQRPSQDVKIQAESDSHYKEQLSEDYDLLKREQEETLRNLQNAHEQEKLLLSESYQKSQASLQETIDKLCSQLKAFQDKMKRVEESILSRDYKKNIQDYGNLSQFWEQELESLHFVIEMKNERIHSLDKKLLNLEMAVESNLLLAEKIKILQQEKEDLQVRMQNHTAETRQLSDELLAIREALEKETQLKKQIHREKEELLYRMLHGHSAGHAFPLSAETSLIAT